MADVHFSSCIFFSHSFGLTQIHSCQKPLAPTIQKPTHIQWTAKWTKNICRTINLISINSNTQNAEWTASLTHNSNLFHSNYKYYSGCTSNGIPKLCFQFTGLFLVVVAAAAACWNLIALQCIAGDGIITQKSHSFVRMAKKKKKQSVKYEAIE